MKTSITRNLTIIISLLVVSASWSVAQPVIGTTTFDGTNSTIAPFASLPRSGTVDGWSFNIDGAGSGSITHSGAETPSRVTLFGQTVSTISIGSDDGSEFNFDNYVVQFFSFAGTYTITAYKDNVAVGSTTATASSTYGTLDLSANTDFDDIDEIRLTGFGGSDVTLNIDEITISATPSNSAPTASGFTAADGPYEDLTYTFSTSDFSYNDSDGDPMSHLLIEAVPGAGTLYVDADNDDTYDGGEELSVSDQVTKADLDAGNLQYIQNGSTNTTFQFEVNDGTENSTGNYIATLNVLGIPTVTLGVSPASRVESISTNATVTATLSNAYGANTTVSLAFSGTATNSSDYTRSGTSIPITAGSTSGSVTLSNQSDALYEGDETVVIDISGVTNGTEDGVQQVTYTITEDDPQPTATLLLRNVYDPIADESGGEAYIVSQLSAVAGVTVTVPLSFSGTATGGGTDYGISGSSIVISPGEPRDSISVTSVFDGIEEGDETVIIDMDAPTNATENGTQQVTLTIIDEDAAPPSGYAVSIDQSPINSGNETAASFTFASAEVGATYDYTFSSSGGGTNVTGSGTIATATDQITGIDLSGLGDGTITLSATLTDGFGNTGTAATDTETKDTSAPTGYSVTIDQAGINASNESATSFTFAGAEVGTTYDYTFSSSGGGTNVTGSGTITTATDQITGIDLSGLGDGTITLSVTLTDTNGNTGSAATDTETKDTTAPSGYAVTIDQSPINSTNETTVSFTFAGAEVGAAYNYTFSSSGGGTDVTGSGTIATATDQITGIDLSGLADGTITLSVTLTDAAGNTGSAATDTETKETVPPSGYSVTIDQSPINAGNETVVSFTFAAAEVGATYDYTFSSSGGGTNVTSSGTIVTTTDQISGIDLSGLGDGTITLSVTLTDGNGNVGSAVTDTETKDTSAPTGYTVAFDQAAVNAGNETAISFTFASAETGATYDYTISSTGGGTNVTGSGTITTATDQIAGIDVSGLGDGTLTLSVTLTDINGNTGAAATDNIQKDIGVPSGYSVAIDLLGEPQINVINESIIEFSGSGLEVGTTLNYSFTSDGGGTPVTGTETVTATSEQFDNSGAGYDLSGLTDGTITLTITLTDAAGNTGANATDNEIKDSGPPSGYTVAWDDSFINASEATTASFTVSNAEVGATINNTVSSSGDGNTATVSNPTVVTSNTQVVTIDVSLLVDGTLTVQVSLTDGGGNTGGMVSDNSAVLDQTVPSGYTVSIDQADINAANQGAASFTFAGAEGGTTYDYTFSSSGGGTNVTGSGTIVTATDQITGIDLSSLADGTITLSVTLTDDAGNTGTAATSTVSKDATAPNFISVDDDGGDNSYKSGESLTIVADLGEAGLTVTADLSVINSGLSATTAMTDNADGTYSVAIADADDSGNMIEGAAIAVPLTATDGSGNQQTDNRLTLNLDKTTPAGYSISIDQADINATNHTTMSFTFAGAEIGTTYDYTITSDGGGTPVTGSGTIATATDQITGVDVSGLVNGTITLSVTLTDDAGNTGTAATSTVSKDATAPNFISVDDDGGDNSYKSGESLTIVADLGEAGLTVTADLSVINSGLSATAAMTDNADGTYSVTIANVDDSGNMIEGGAIAVPLTATDGSGNQQTDNRLTLNLDKTAPTGYSISIDQADINATNHTAMSFTFAGAEVGTTYDYTVTSDGGGTPVAGSGTIATATDQITGVDVSGLVDGTITASVTLTDEAGNTGSAATDNVTKTTATVQFNATNGNGDESVPTASLQVDASITSSQDISVEYTVTGTATGGGVDYTLADGTLTIAAGDATGNIDISGIVDDAIAEDDETVIVTLSNPSNATLGTNTEYTYTINDNDGAALSIAATTQAGEDDTDGLFTITTSNQFSTDVNVTFSVSGTATEGTDYEAVGTSITFPASTSSVTIPVTVNADTDVEPDESVIITLTGTDNTSVTIGATADATVTITDNDEKLPQTITFPPIEDKKIGQAPITLNATGGDSGLPVTYSISTQPATGVASLSGDKVIIEGIGMVTITASQAGNDTYEAAEDVSRTFEITSSELFLPTLFTPNNDMTNDRFILRGGAGNINEISMNIFDRDGNLVYQSNSFEELSTDGWNGKSNGTEQPQGAYVWVVTGSFINGSPILINGKNTGIIRLAR